MTAEHPLDQTLCTTVIDTLLSLLHEHYVFPDTAKKIEADLRRRLAAGEYSAISSPRAFCEVLTSHLEAVSHDKHLRLFYYATPQPPHSPGSEDLQRRHDLHAAARMRNFGFYRVERLPGNIGYLDIRAFFPVDMAGDTAIAAMNLCANTSALILDVRRNGGGSPALVALISTYLFPPHKPVHLNSLYWRRADRLDQFWTLPYVPGQRFVDKPVYVLISRETFSGAEEFAYNLQTRKRATLIGEVTRGGAHPGGRFQLSAHIEVFIPTGRAINPITGANWEGTGVTPDIAVPREQALAVAHTIALKQVLAELGTNPAEHMQEFVDEAQQALAELSQHTDAGVAWSGAASDA